MHWNQIVWENQKWHLNFSRSAICDRSCGVINQNMQNVNRSISVFYITWVKSETTSGSNMKKTSQCTRFGFYLCFIYMYIFLIIQFLFIWLFSILFIYLFIYFLVWIKFVLNFNTIWVQVLLTNNVFAVPTASSAQSCKFKGTNCLKKDMWYRPCLIQLKT